MAQYKYEWDVTQQNKITLLLDELEQYSTDNYTLLGWKVTLSATQYGTITSTAKKNWVINVDTGVSSGNNSIAINANETKVLCQGTTKVYHNADGTKTVSWRFAQEFYITFNGVAIDLFDKSGTTKLTPIAKTSLLSVVSKINLGSVVPLNIYAKSDVFIHKLYYRFNGENTIVANGTQAKTVYWTADYDLAYQFGETEFTKPIQWVLETYGADGLTLVGTYTVDCILVLTEKAAPTIDDVQISDLNNLTATLTGDSYNTFVRDKSNVQIVTFATPKYNATIKSFKVFNESGQQINSQVGIINAIRDANFTVEIIDSRGIKVWKTIQKNLIYYVTPTVNITNIDADSHGNLSFRISGKCFNGSFGALNNTNMVSYRYRIDNGEWLGMYAANNLTYDGDNYYVDINLTGLNYRDTYQIQAQHVDMFMNTLLSDVYSSKVKPVFDWGEDDFNFNVPVTIEGGKVYSAHELWSGSNVMVSQLADDIKNYDFIEIYFTDNNGNQGGYTKVWDTKVTKETPISLSLIEATVTGGTYIRRGTFYHNGGKVINPDHENSGYVFIGANNAVQSMTGESYIKITKVIGYK